MGASITLRRVRPTVRGTMADMQRVRFCFLYLWLCCSCPAIQAQTHRVQVDGETTVRQNIGRQEIVASLRTWSVPEQLRKTGVSFAQCSGSRVPCLLTEKMAVSINGTAIPLPRSAYADLGDVSTVELKSADYSIVLLVHGGDASESYMAKLIFERGALIKRELYSSEDSAHPVEISRYFP